MEALGSTMGTGIPFLAIKRQYELSQMLEANVALLEAAIAECEWPWIPARAITSSLPPAPAALQHSRHAPASLLRARNGS